MEFAIKSKIVEFFDAIVKDGVIVKGIEVRGFAPLEKAYRHSISLANRNDMKRHVTTNETYRQALEIYERTWGEPSLERVSSFIGPKRVRFLQTSL